MSHSGSVTELSPGAARAYEASWKLAKSIHAVPQHEELRLALEDGWECWLSRYVYRPLSKPNEIRILRLYPRDDRLRTADGILPRCELVNVSLDSSPEYAAVSYAWGDLDKYSPVLLDENKCLMVTNSLFEALCRLSSDEVLDFWVDQLCINQYDSTERSNQVRLMGRIFGQALVTFACLGSGDNATDSAFDVIDRLARSDLSLSHSFDLFSNEDLDGLKSILQLQNIDCDVVEPGWRGIEGLSLRPWFSRLWTFQEIALSGNVHFICGRYSCSHDDLLRAFYVMRLLNKRSTAGMSNTELLRVFRAKCLSGRFPHLLDLLQEVTDSSYECTEPRDRIYAILALQDPKNPCPIPVDYNAPIEAVFSEVAKIVIASTASLALLHRRRFGYLEDLPSWVPDWSVQDTSIRIDDSRMLFSCSNGLRHVFEDTSRGHLITRGRIITKIARTAAHRFSDHEIHYREGQIKKYLGSATLIPQVTAVLEKSSILDGTQVDKRKKYLDWLLAMTFTCGRFKVGTEACFNTENTESVQDLATAIAAQGPSMVRSLRKCLGRKIGILDNDTYPLGLVPDFARAGDFICALNGSSTPLILRRFGQQFEFIGECYVHGLMYGEATTWSQEEGDRIIIK